MTTRPRLGRWGDQGINPKDDHVVIFVHGILSDSTTFNQMLPTLRGLDATSPFDLWTFDYDYRQSLVDSADKLGDAIERRAFGERRVDIVGHSMGGLVARLAVLRRNLPRVSRIVTLATPNHGTISGEQLNLLGQMTTLRLRRLDPVYPRSSGILDLTNTHTIMRKALERMHKVEPGRLEGKTYVSIPAQYFHTKRQMGDTLPSMLMGSVSFGRKLLNMISSFRVTLRPVHDGIVEERSNQLHPAPVGSSNEGKYMRNRDEAGSRILHVTHEAAADYDHVTVVGSREVAILLRAVLLAESLDETGVDPFLEEPRGQVTYRPLVV
ncbi:esterase/lipase family protein [Rhizobium laguerreae]|uniref:esterase/lipase family protein n=1 Tax=Rhizobium laguerreae TaxID=1076926 RepID=UPI001C914669|nr:alpha/beta fold hydrolase [Rhizobium laguerreae]MBY3187918.1 alpha/beta fold hydrolase [Rhizobium laguerreae]